MSQGLVEFGEGLVKSVFQNPYLDTRGRRERDGGVWKASDYAEYCNTCTA